MKQVGFYLLLLVVTVHCASNMDFIKTSCKTTLHPALCVRCLSSYAASIQVSDHHLAKAAVAVSLKDTKSAAIYISKLARLPRIKPKEYRALKDCISTMSNSVLSLSQSVQELALMDRSKGQDFEWHMSNVETWVGSALTNQNICGRGFADKSMNGRVKDAVSGRMVYVSQVTSNALALLSRFAVRHRKGIHMP